MKSCARCGAQLPDDSCFCQFCGVRLAAARTEAPAAPDAPGETKRQPGRMAVVVLSVLAALLAGLALWQGAAAHRLKQEAEARSALLDTQRGEIAELERQRRALAGAINGSGTPGFGSMYFFASDGVIMVDHTRPDTTFTLYTPQHPDNYRVCIDTEGDSAEVTLTESEWDFDTTVCVTPKKPGMTIAAFSSSAGTAGFRVYIIVV